MLSLRMGSAHIWGGEKARVDLLQTSLPIPTLNSREYPFLWAVYTTTTILFVFLAYLYPFPPHQCIIQSTATIFLCKCKNLPFLRRHYHFQSPASKILLLWKKRRPWTMSTLWNLWAGLYYKSQPSYVMQGCEKCTLLREVVKTI